MLAGAQALREAINTQLEPDEQEAHDQLVRTIEAALGEERFAALWTSAHALPHDDLLALLDIAIGADTAAEADHPGETSPSTASAPAQVSSP